MMSLIEQNLLVAVQIKLSANDTIPSTKYGVTKWFFLYDFATTTIYSSTHT